MKKIYLISTIILFVATVILVLTVNFYPKTQNGKNGNTIEKKGIVVVSPKENEVISSQLKIEGYVNSDGWIGFEGQVGIVRLFDEQDNELGMAILTADGEWMQTKINFKTTLWFDYPGEGQGKLVFYNENPSGEAERNKTFTLPVMLQKSSSAKNVVKAYFNNNQMDPEYSCNKVFPLEREVPKTTAVAKAAVEELLRGISLSEKNAGYFTSINEGVKIQSLIIENGVAKVDFNGQLEFQVGGSCKAQAIRAQIEQTLKQFSTVRSVAISIDGRIEDILQP